MTHRAAKRGLRIPRIWILPLLVIVGLTGAAYLGYFSRSLVLDLAAWWPVWLLLILLIVLARGRRIGKVRVSGLVPLLAFVALGLFIYAHIAGWPMMPSASQVLVGPEVSPGTVAALSARVDGELEVSGGAEHLYRVDPIRWGGDIGLPEAVEQTQGDAISVALKEPEDSGFYEFAGWDLTLASRLEWSLTLDGVVNADLAGLEISEIQLSGNGDVRLGGTVVPTPVNVFGAFVITVPDGVAVRVIGKAIVPTGWDETAGGYRSPTPGDGWVISVSEGASLAVVAG